MTAESVKQPLDERSRTLNKKLTIAVEERRAKATATSAGALLGLKQRKLKGRTVTMIDAVEGGLKFDAMEHLATKLELTTNELGENYLGLTRPTISRRRKEGQLKRSESDATVRYARLLEQAIELMEGDRKSALQWLNSSLPILSGRTPMEYSITETGAREIEQLIGRLEHGVFS